MLSRAGGIAPAEIELGEGERGKEKFCRLI
jgi:hypothetical protein